MKGLSEADRRLVVRYVDAALSAPERAAVERRLLAEPLLRAAVEQQRAARVWLRAAAEKEPLPSPTAGFAARVLDSVRRLPSRDELLAAEEVVGVDASLLVLARRIIAAALVVFAVGMAVWGGVLRHTDPVRLEASDIRRIEQLDAQIEAATARRERDRLRGGR